MPTITSIIINYNAGEALSRCVTTLLASTQQSQVYVVDNHSTDNSIALLRNRLGHGSPVQILQNPDNPGFGPALNRISQRIDTDYLLVLNPDCEVEKDCVAKLSQALSEHPDAGIAGPMVVDQQDNPQRATVRRFPTPWRSLMTFSGLWRLGKRFPALAGVEIPGKEAKPGPVEAVSGACLMIRHHVFKELGYMDEAYILHCEDLDLMYRFRQAGWKTLFVPEARAMHVQGVSSASRPVWVHYQKHKGMQRFYRKFQAGRNNFLVNGVVSIGIYLKFLLTLPLVWLKR